jgi:hypothetical protein
MDLSENSKILIGIEHVKILLSNNYATESILATLSKKNFGDLSSASARALKTMANGATVDIAIEKTGAEDSIKRILTLLKTENRKIVLSELDKISDSIISRKKLSSKNFVTRFETLAVFIILLLLAPMESILVQLLSYTAELYLEKPMVLPQFLDEAVLLLSFCGLMLIFWFIRYRE